MKTKRAVANSCTWAGFWIGLGAGNLAFALNPVSPYPAVNLIVAALCLCLGFLQRIAQPH